MLEDIALLVIGLYILLYVTWIHYLAIMNLSRNQRKLMPFAKFWAYNALAIGYPLDVLFNIFFGTIFFLELPKELLFTARCDRHLNDKDWRGRNARFFCQNMLDPFDPKGTHCRASD